MQDTEEKDQSNELPFGAILLQGQYDVETPLAYGGFGITYLARDSLERRVVVKECFPNEICERSGNLVLAKDASFQESYRKIVWEFVGEARRLAKLKHPNIVAVHQVFEENHTAYMAMDFVDGEELLNVLETSPERVTPALVRNVLSQVLDALQYLHGLGILHRDISPDNLLLDLDDQVTLIDFGSAQEISQTSRGVIGTSLSVKDGYSPYEFYMQDSEQSEASDLYSVGATIYHLITGKAPVDCWTRLEAIHKDEPDPYEPLAGGDWGLTRDFLELIDQALAVTPEKRLQSAAEWLEVILCLDNAESGADVATEARAYSGQIQPVPAKVMSGEAFNEAISELVASVNMDVENASQSRKPEGGQKLPPQESIAQDPPKQTPVDIFGNVIENVSAWMREQDSMLQKQAAPPDTPPEPQRDLIGERQEKSRYLRLLRGRFFNA
ncbi:serine/threonine protein kinase [Marimonas lutisalis]|uniref:serine/threonine protein kinase n=1 Tax=Marimonas lutisalis TaxID=2545756 RepID=UPI0013762D0D|nr:serine/threonine-protein kinase [Marimonas lutisalis]